MPRNTRTADRRPPTARQRIHSRKPTGKVTWPCILVEGEEKAGKTWLAYQLSKSDKIGAAFAIDLGEGSADEYASIGNYEVLMADPDNPLAPWTFPALLDQVSAVRDFAREQIEAGEKPVMLTIDTMSDEWGVLVDAITAKAARSEKNRRMLAEDPAAEVKVPNHLWNDANAKHRRLMTMLLTFPGIVVLTARGKEVAEIRNGSPVEGSKVWKVEGQKNLAYDVTAWIRMRRNAPPTLEGCRSVHIGLRPGIDAARELPEEFREGGLEWFIFDALRLDPGTAAVRDLRSLTDDGEALDASEMPQTPAQVLDRVRAAWGSLPGLNVLAREIRGRGFEEYPVPNAGKTLGDLVADRVNELAAAEEVKGDGAEAPESPPEQQEPGSDAQRLRAAAAQQQAERKAS